jgi:hypothetical protein
VVITGCWDKFREVDCVSVRVRECSYRIEKCWMSTPSRVGLDEVIFGFDIGGSDMISEIAKTLVLRCKS